jgi:glycosyltransferase involved in cell wall biosynthesis
MIVGAEEHEELERCLKSVRGLFDEIVVVVTSFCPKTRAVADKYASRVCYFKWVRDFASARNFALDQMTTDYVMWLDSDDIIKPANAQRIKNLELEHDVYEFFYIYAHDNRDKPTNVLHRERVWKRSLNLRWVGRIHEATDYLDKAKSVQRRFDIFVDHYRARTFNPDRNISILREEYEANPENSRMHYYLARELFLTNKDYQMLEDYCLKGIGTVDELATASRMVAQRYLEIKAYDKAKEFATRAITISEKYAEPFVILGNIAQALRDIDTAIKFNEIAYSKTFDAGLSQDPYYYFLWPANNLSILYAAKEDFEQSLKYNAKALEWDPGNPGLLRDRQNLFNLIGKPVSFL